VIASRGGVVYLAVGNANCRLVRAGPAGECRKADGGIITDWRDGYKRQGAEFSEKS
jgi:hypothetical protein